MPENGHARLSPVGSKTGHRQCPSVQLTSRLRKEKVCETFEMHTYTIIILDARHYFTIDHRFVYHFQLLVQVAIQSKLETMKAQELVVATQRALTNAPRIAMSTKIAGRSNTVHRSINVNWLTLDSQPKTNCTRTGSCV